MTPLQRLNVQHWADVLRSGAYPKTIRKLKNEDGYCCLGVLCEIQEVPHETEHGYMFPDGSVGYMFPDGSVGYSMPTQPWFEETTGLPMNYADRLAHINDAEETFAAVILEIERFLET
jgi:hypothetical protein